MTTGRTTPEKGPSHESQSASCAHRRRAPDAGGRRLHGHDRAADRARSPTPTTSTTPARTGPSSPRSTPGSRSAGSRGRPGTADIKGIDEGFSQYLRLYWEAQELPTDEAVIAWGDVGLPEMNTQLWASNNSFVVAMYYRVAFQVSLANEFLRQTTDAKLAERNVSPELAADIQVFRAEARFLRALSYWHGIDLFGNIPLVTEDDPIGLHGAAPEHPPGDLRFPGERAERHPGRSAGGRRPGNLWPRHQGSRGHAAGQAVSECRGLHRHAAVRPGAGGGAGR